eukprot:8816232-Alexandrium_andersonii.AAC.1
MLPLAIRAGSAPGQPNTYTDGSCAGAGTPFTSAGAAALFAGRLCNAEEVSGREAELGYSAFHAEGS